MGVSTFNYTGRKDFLRTGGDNPEVEIKIYDQGKLNKQSSDVEIQEAPSPILSSSKMT